MDNLFNSKKLYEALYRTEALSHGVAHTKGQGIPPSIIQKEEKNISRAEQLCGTTMAPRLINYDACPNLLAASVYDTKPVNILSCAAVCVKWIVTSEAAPCPLQPCYFAKWDIFADTSDCQYAMGFPVCILDNFLPILPISCHILMSEWDSPIFEKLLFRKNRILCLI